MYIGVELDKLNNFEKFKLILKGKMISFFQNKLSDSNFIIFINNIFRFKNKIFIKNNLIYVSDNNSTIYFPNLFRALNYLNGFDQYLNQLFESYCLEKITFNNSDLIVDCGANIGELNQSFINKNLNLNYVAFEPDKDAFLCLELNSIEKNAEIFNIALSDSSTEKTFYVDSVGANSSLEYFGNNFSYKVNCKKLDDFKLKNIKLLKMDAEGHELQALKGAESTLKTTMFISVDFGEEKGVLQEHTIVDVTNYLYSQNFSLIDYSSKRMVGLFKNNKINF